MSSEWPLVPLGEVAEIVMGQSPPGTSYNGDGEGVPLLNGPTEFGARYPVVSVHTTAPTKISRSGDVLFCVRGSTTGRMNLADREYCLGRGVAAIRGSSPAATLLIRASLTARLPSLLAVVSGSTFPNLSRGDLASFEVPWPPIDEQRRIAGVLGALDDKIEHNQSLASRLIAAAAARVDHALRSSVAVAPIYDAATVTYGRAFKSDFFGAEGTPLLRIRDLATHEPGLRTTEQISKARLVKPGDIVVGMDGEFRAHLWRGPDSFLNQRVCVFDPAPGVSRAYLWRAIQTPLAFVEGTEAGTTVIHLGKADIDQFELPRPSDEAMRDLIDSVDPMASLAVHLGRETRTLTAIRDALLPKLVSGKLRVPESYVPA